MATPEISVHAVRLWQHLIDMLALCNACGGKLIVGSPVIDGEATVRCSECPKWYRYRVENDQLYYDELVEFR